MLKKWKRVKEVVGRYRENWGVEVDVGRVRI